MRQSVLQIGPYAVGDPDGISLSQTPAAGGIQSLLLNGAFVSGGVATLDTPRQVIITSAGDDTGRVFLIKGANLKGNQVIEAIVGANAAPASTVQAFSTVTSIQVDGDTAGAVQAGTATVVSTNWLPLDVVRNPVNVGLIINANGATMNLDVELTGSNLLSRRGDNPLPTVGSHLGSEFGLIYPALNIIDHDSLVAVTADQSGNLGSPTTGLRLVSNAAITGGTPDMTVMQSGHRGA